MVTMSLSGHSVLLLATCQTLAAVIPTAIISAACLMCLVFLGEASVAPTRLQVSLLLTSLCGSIGTLVSSYGLVQFIGIWITNQRKTENNGATTVYEVLKEERLCLFFLVGFDFCLVTFGLTLWTLVEAFLANNVSFIWVAAFGAPAAAVFSLVSAHYLYLTFR